MHFFFINMNVIMATKQNIYIYANYFDSVKFVNIKIKPHILFLMLNERPKSN
jgi:hypothetical protein